MKKMAMHGMSGTPEYQVWVDMKQRCQNPRNASYDRYGGRGVKVCDRWQTFLNFYADVGPRPSAQHSLDRFPDNNGNYEPGNVRWATVLEQNHNTRMNVRVTFQGETLVISEWARRLGLDLRTIRNRLRTLPVEVALSAPRNPLGKRIAGDHARVATGRSGLKGVYPEPKTGKWRARITVSGRRYHLGVFESALAAAKAYNEAALALVGKNAWVNPV